jgi:hypothetical protein
LYPRTRGREGLCGHPALHTPPRGDSPSRRGARVVRDILYVELCLGWSLLMLSHHARKTRKPLHFPLADDEKIAVKTIATTTPWLRPDTVPPRAKPLSFVELLRPEADESPSWPKPGPTHRRNQREECYGEPAQEERGSGVGADRTPILGSVIVAGPIKNQWPET